ncbi:unnamed protein product [Polarella glacialis]|uniref:Uncharacterized protein n=1 Tax=Polarella glacialis TaxID=89957 RepID=A0A813JV00_POLGL|nr:unnamed protein product [Polarella glacialis]
MTGEEPAEASHTQAVQTQDPLTPSVGSVTVVNATSLPLSSSDLDEPAPAVLANGTVVHKPIVLGCPKMCFELDVYGNIDCAIISAAFWWYYAACCSCCCR